MRSPAPRPGAARRRDTWRLVVPADRRLAACLAKRLAASATAASGIGTDAGFRLRLVLAEALDNAVRHGCRDDPSRRPRLACRVRPGRVRVTVTDGGRGFTAEREPDPREARRRERAGGRGLFLIARMSDRLRLDRRGSRIELVVERRVERPR